MTQKNLSPRQYRWVELLNEFIFVIEYIPGETNVLADALSRIYSDEPSGVVRSPSELIPEDSESDGEIPVVSGRDMSSNLSSPVYTGSTVVLEAGVRRSKRLANLKNSEDRGKEVHLTAPISSASKGKGGRRPKATESKPNLNGLKATSGEEEEAKSGGDAFPREVALQLEVNQPRSFAEILPENSIHELETSTAPLLTEIISEGDPGFAIPDQLKGKYSEDKFFREIIQRPMHFKDFMVSEGLIFFVKDHRKVLCVPDIKIENRSAREIIITHAHSILAHLGARKTLFYLRDNVWWPNMIKDVTDYCNSCTLCAMSKPSNQKPMGLLRTLEVPTYPWQAIGIDFVGPLPASRNRHGEFDAICVIIDHLTSMVHLVSTKITYGAKDMAEIIFDEVYKRHGLPERIISDRDVLFTAIFWRELHRLLGVELRLSSSYHPQTDGATERANRTMTQMLRQCVSLSQKDWVSKLPAIEYAMNCARSDTTGFSPFYLNYGRMPRPLIWEVKSEFPGVRKFAERMKEAIMTAHDEIIEARVKQTIQANRNCRPSDFKVGQLVYLSTKNLKLPKNRARKLTPKFISPFSILEVLESGATYKLELSLEFKKNAELICHFMLRY